MLMLSGLSDYSQMDLLYNKSTVMDMYGITKSLFHLKQTVLYYVLCKRAYLLKMSLKK